MKQKLLMQFAGVAAIALIGGFVGGMRYGEGVTSGLPDAARGGRFGNGQLAGDQAANGGRRMMSGAGFVSGDILSKDETTVTVKLQDGGSRIVLYSPSTQIGRFVTSTDMSELVVGARVTITGSTNADGSVTAQTIQIRPAGQLPGGPGMMGTGR